jgi:hypothetical protein
MSWIFLGRLLGWARLLLSYCERELKVLCSVGVMRVCYCAGRVSLAAALSMFIFFISVYFCVYTLRTLSSYLVR